MKHSKPLVLGLVVLSTALAACQTGPAPLSDADHQALDAVEEGFKEAMLAGDGEQIASYYAEDAILMPPNAPMVRGRAAIADFMSEFPPVTEISLSDEAVEGVGDAVYTYGTYRLTLGLPGAPQDEGKYLDIRTRQADGSWKYQVDMFSSNLPAAAEEAAEAPEGEPDADG